MRKNLLVLFASAAVLAACGGDDETVAAAPTPAPAPAPAPAPSPSTAVPDTAGATVQSFIDYVTSLIATSSETASPLAISAGFTAAGNDTDSPRTLP